MMTKELLAACKEHIRSARSTLWGQAFEVHSEAGADEAALWLCTQFKAVLAHLAQQVEGEARLFVEDFVCKVAPVTTTPDEEEQARERLALLKAAPPPKPIEDWHRPSGW